MAVVAYLFPPLSGLLAYFVATDARARFHGLQSVLFGALWPASLYVSSWVGIGATQAAAAVGGMTWALLLLFSALGKDPGFPLVGGWLRRATEVSPRATGAP